MNLWHPAHRFFSFLACDVQQRTWYFVSLVRCWLNHLAQMKHVAFRSWCSVFAGSFPLWHVWHSIRAFGSTTLCPPLGLLWPWTAAGAPTE